MVSLEEIYRSESILKLKTLLANNIELTPIISSITDEESIILEDFVQSLTLENFDHISISQDAIHVITSLSGYISHSLLKSIDCEACRIALNNDPVSSAYLDYYNKGRLKLPTSSLNSYTQCAFSILNHQEQRILEVDVLSKVLAQSILNHLSSEWDDLFVCHNHSMVGLNIVNSIISNCYLKNLARDVTETRKGIKSEKLKELN